jgi:hypothetical protein
MLVLELLALTLALLLFLRRVCRSMGLCQSKPLAPQTPDASALAADKTAPAPAPPAATFAAAAATQEAPAPLAAQPALAPQPDGGPDGSKPIDLSQASAAATASAATPRWAHMQHLQR